MKQSYTLSAFLWLVGILVVLCGCADLSQSQKQDAVTKAVSPTQLKPEGNLPASCLVTPVYQGGQGSLSEVLWVQAQPTSLGILGHLFAAHSATMKSGTYRFLHTGGGYPDGSTTKILWTVDHPQTSDSLQIDGTNLSSSGKTFHQTIAWTVVGNNEIPSIVVVPNIGCWHLQVSSGSAKGSITVWVVG